MPTKTFVEIDKVQDVANKVFQATRGMDTNLITLRKHGSSLATLLTDVGSSTQTTVVVSEDTPVTANADLTLYPNIHWIFVGSGKLTPTTGVSLKLYSPGTIIADPSQYCLDASAGTITFAKSGVVHVGWFGAKNDGVTQSVAFINRAIASLPSVGGKTLFEGGIYLVNGSIVIAIDKVTLEGAGISSTIITSTAIGVATIKLVGELVFGEVTHMWLAGNGISGAGGCGHGISMIDPTPGTGALSPQQFVINRVRISGFKGNDSDGRGGSMLACGIAQVSTLENTIRDCYIDSNQHGVYCDSVFTPRLYDNVILGNTKYGVYVQGVANPIESLHLQGNDILNNGDGSTFAQIGWASAPTGNVFAYNVQGLSLVGNKFKNGSLANVMLHFCEGTAAGGNWIRADNQHGVYVRNCNGFKFSGNEIDQSSASGNPCRYLTIEMESGHNAYGFEITGNKFRFQGGINLPSCIKIMGDAAVRRFQGFKIEANDFGEESVGSATTITDVIKVEQATLSAGSISFNSFYAETNVTITNGIHSDLNSAIDPDVAVDDNKFLVNGGAITNTILMDVGTITQRFRGAGSPEGNVRACRGSIYQRKDGGAGTGFYVKETGDWTNTGWVAK